MTQSLLNKLKDFFSTQPVEKVWLFGSFARGEESAESDVDLLVEFTPQTKIGLLYFRMIADLEEICGRAVDLMERTMLHPSAERSVASEKVLIYMREEIIPLYRQIKVYLAEYASE